MITLLEGILPTPQHQGAHQLHKTNILEQNISAIRAPAAPHETTSSDVKPTEVAVAGLTDQQPYSGVESETSVPTLAVQLAAPQVEEPRPSLERSSLERYSIPGGFPPSGSDRNSKALHLQRPQLWRALFRSWMMWTLREILEIVSTATQPRTLKEMDLGLSMPLLIAGRSSNLQHHWIVATLLRSLSTDQQLWTANPMTFQMRQLQDAGSTTPTKPRSADKLGCCLPSLNLRRLQAKSQACASIVQNGPVQPESRRQKRPMSMNISVQTLDGQD